MIAREATEGVEVKVMLVLVALLLVGGGAIVFSGVLGPSEKGVFHPDHPRVCNGFQDATSKLVGGDGASIVPHDSECMQVDDAAWRCYRRWAPVGHPEADEILQSDVNVYDGRVVVGSGECQPRSDGAGGQSRSRTSLVLCPTSHLVTMLKANRGFPVFGNQRAAWEAGSRFDFEKPGYR